MVADAVDHDRADAVREIGEAILDREDDAVVERIALGRAVETHGQHRVLFSIASNAVVRRPRRQSVSHGLIVSRPE